MAHDTDRQIKLPWAGQEEGWQLYVAQFKSTAMLNDGPEPTPIQVEIVVSGQPDDEQRLVIAEFRRFTMYSAPSDELGGSLSLIGPSYKVQVDPGSSGIMPDFYTRIYYPLLSEWGPACEESDAVYPRLETLVGTLNWQSENGGQEGPMPVLINLTLEEVVEGVAGFVKRLEFEPVEPVLFYLSHQLPSPEAGHNSLTNCSGPAPAGTAYNQRGLKMRFVSVSNTMTAASLEASVQKWIDCTCKVWWAKGGVKIVPDPQIHTCNYPAATPGVVAQAQETGITACEPSVPDHDWIHVYLVDQLDPGRGGGITHNCGTNKAFALLEIGKAVHNQYLLAHEMCHVLGLRHPGEPPPAPTAKCQSYQEGSYCSVALPSAPVSSRNTWNNISVIETNQYPLVYPVFSSLPGNTDWDPDQAQGFFHLIRDFPYDDGTQASVPEPPFFDWWSHSDVWSSSLEPKTRLGGFRFEPLQYADLSDMFNPDHSPVHSDPRHVGSNLMYVRLHTCQPLSGQTTPRVNVYLYLAVPGASTAPLRPLNSSLGPHLVFQDPDPAGASSLPLPAAPKTKWIQWTVPSQLPAHCCVFAVAVSNYDSPPSIIQNIIANPANFQFHHLASLLKSDNDVAQRNLYIQNSTAATFGLSSTLPWTAMANPFDQPVSAHVEVDASRAGRLAALGLEVDRELVRDVKIGHQVRVHLTDSLAPAEHRILRLRAKIPPDLALGTTFPIDLRFFVNGELITGYTHLLRVAPLEETVAQVLDQLYGALRTVQDAFEISVEAMMTRVEQSIVAAAQDPAGALGDMCRDLAPLLGQIARPRTPVGDEPEHQAVYESLAQLVDLFESAGADDDARGLLDTFSPNQLAERIRDLADRIQEPAGRLARRRAHA